VVLMANPEHLAKLKEGIEAWNLWRRQNLDILPDLSQADLHGANLRGVNFVRVMLTGANLCQANLRRTDLSFTNLQLAALAEADLNRALLSSTVLGNTNLTRAKGLETCIHGASSIIDFQTIAQSGPLPLAFLRGCGLPDNLISYLPSLLSQPIQFYSCFISYSNKDQDFAERLYVDLQNKGVRCWFAPEDLKIGDRFRQRIDEAIRLHEKLLVILSAHSMESDWVREEVESCLERERRERQAVLFPVRLDDTVMDTKEAWAATVRRQRHIGDFRQWKKHDAYQTALERLIRDLKTENSAGKPGL